MSDPAWGVTYVLHGLGGVGFVGLIIAHIYFALRPEKLWITKSMVFGYITRRAVSRTPRSRTLEIHIAGTVSSDLREDLARRVDAIEAGYELMLAYAAQGLPSDTMAANSGQLREHLRRFDEALTDLADRYREFVGSQDRLAPEAFEGFLDVLTSDARSAQAGLRLVMAQPSISSQLVDNLNASIHVRALLTDIFLIDEALK